MFGSLLNNQNSMGSIRGFFSWLTCIYKFLSKWLVTPIYKSFRPFGREITLLRGLTITMDTNRLQVLKWSSKNGPFQKEVGSSSKNCFSGDMLPWINIPPENGWLETTFLLGRPSSFHDATSISKKVHSLPNYLNLHSRQPSRPRPRCEW